MNTFRANPAFQRQLSHCPLFVLVVAMLLAACNSSQQTTAKQPAARQETKVIFPTQHQATPAHVGYVDDREGLFSETEVKSLDSLARNFERSNLISIKIITISDSNITLENFDTANKTALQNWGVLHGNGDKCMTISISKNLHRIRIDFGVFVSKLLSDDETKTIIEKYFTPAFKQENYFQGTVDGLKAIMDTIRRNIKL